MLVAARQRDHALTFCVASAIVLSPLAADHPDRGDVLGGLDLLGEGEADAARQVGPRPHVAHNPGAHVVELVQGRSLAMAPVTDGRTCWPPSYPPHQRRPPRAVEDLVANANRAATREHAPTLAAPRDVVAGRLDLGPRA